MERYPSPALASFTSLPFPLTDKSLKGIDYSKFFSFKSLRVVALANYLKKKGRKEDSQKKIFGETTGGIEFHKDKVLRRHIEALLNVDQELLIIILKR
jgi:hypothetical protein